MNQYYQVNWINGMKIISQHFEQLENHFIYRIQKSLKGTVTPITYGLIPDSKEAVTSPQVVFSSSKDKVKIINGFVALTPDGHLIQVPPNEEFPLQKPIIPAEYYYLVVSAEPYSRVSFSQIDGQEDPPRYPYIMQAYRFEFFTPKDEYLHVIEENKVPVGKYNGIIYEEDRRYIPPCSSVQSHPDLIALCKSIQKSISDLETRILGLLKTKDHSSNSMFNNILNFNALNKSFIDIQLPYEAPFFLLEKIQQLARIIRYSKDRENNNVLSEIVNFNYNHIDIRQSVARIETFLSSYTQYLPFDSKVRP